jgi:hypothetical protein
MDPPGLATKRFVFRHDQGGEPDAALNAIERGISLNNSCATALVARQTG